MKKTHIIGIIIIAVAIGAILSTVSSTSEYVSFGEAEQDAGKQFHVVGTLNKDKEMTYDPAINANLFSFYLADNEGIERKVNFKGTKPQDFERSEQVVLIGYAEDGEFEAEKILMKCPSKYNEGAPEGEFQEFSASAG